LTLCSCNVTETVFDLRQIMPRMRHSLIFGTFDQVDEAGEISARERS
jgi:uncharacterized protein (DUF2249 family)